MSRKYVVLYESSDNVLEKAPLHMEAHRAHYKRYVDDGTLLMVGTFADPQADGSMSVFSTREAAERFAREDPFVVNGVVRDWRLLEWDEILTP